MRLCMIEIVLIALLCIIFTHVSSFSSLPSSKFKTATPSLNMIFQRGKANNSVKKIEPIVIPKDYKLSIGCWVLSSVFDVIIPNGAAIGVPLGLLALLLGVQANRVRFGFDNEAMEVYKVKVEDKKEILVTEGENFAVGGQNRWKYSTFTQWAFIPSKEIPIFMYFKENQTKNPDGKPQFHLFPVIMKADKLYDALMEKVGPK